MKMILTYVPMPSVSTCFYACAILNPLLQQQSTTIDHDLPSPAVVNVQEIATESITNENFYFGNEAVFLGYKDKVCDFTAMVQLENELLGEGAVTCTFPGVHLWLRVVARQIFQGGALHRGGN